MEKPPHAGATSAPDLTPPRTSLLATTSAQGPQGEGPGRLRSALLVLVVTLTGALALASLSAPYLARLGIGEGVADSAINFVTHSLFILGGIVMIRASGLRMPGLSPFPRKRGGHNLRRFAIIATPFALVAVATDLAPPFTKVSMSPLGWALTLLFQGVFVGWSEEFLFRAALQNILNQRFSRGRTIFRMRRGTFVASVVFGAVHLGNAFLGQSVSSAAGEAAFALAFAFAVGWYYEKTQDLAGAAWIHNATDGLGTFATFLFSVL